MYLEIDNKLMPFLYVLLEFQVNRPDVWNGRNIGIIKGNIDEYGQPQNKGCCKQKCKNPVHPVFEGEGSKKDLFSVTINHITQ